MPYKDPKSPAAIASAKKGQKKYRENNKEKIALKNKEWNDNNKEYRKQYKIDNPKSDIISLWKVRGVIDEDFDALYEYFITQTNCWICDKVYNKDIKMDRRCLDHNHDTGEVRYICCNYCNFKILS